MTCIAVRAALAAAALALAVPVCAHEVLHEVERGRAVAVHVLYAGGEPLAYVEAEVFSPADPRIPHWRGRTDRNGWVSFVPDVPGAWRLRVVDSTGHGLDTTVEIPVAGEAAPGPRGASGSSLGIAVRPLVGVAIIAAAFGVLYALGRRGKR